MQSPSCKDKRWKNKSQSYNSGDITVNLKTDDLVLCTVKKIEGTTVFVDIENNGQGSIVMSEIAAGRIRNIREYVFPNKKIVCKVLKTFPDHAELSLRRVTVTEKESVLDKDKKEKILQNVLRANVKNHQEIIDKIKESYDLSEFIEEAKKNQKILEKFIPKDQIQLIIKMLSEKKEKEVIIKKKFTLISHSPSGLNDLKEILNIKNVEIHYLGSGAFSIIKSSSNPKEAEKEILLIFDQIAEKAKQKKMLFSIKEK